MKKKHRKSFLLKIAAAVFAVYIVVTLIYLSVQIRQKSDELAQTTNKVSSQLEENDKNKRILAEPDEKFMESVAREKLGYAKPSEKVFVDASGN